MINSANLFKMLVEFKFEAGNALLSSNTLKGSLDKISEAANFANDSILRMFTTFSSGMLGVGSASTVMYNSLKAFERFADKRNQFNAILGANQKNLQGIGIDTYEGRSIRSEQILKQIAKKAGEFNLDEGEFAATSKLLIASLAPKGLAGDNFNTALDVSRNYMKTLPMLGLDPSLAMGQLIDAIGGNAMKGRLFERLKDDTSTFRDYNDGKGIKTTKQFNALEAAERLRVINDAMAEFTNDADVMADRMNSINAQMGKLKDAFFGLDGVFIELGKTINTHAVAALEQVNEIVSKSIAPILRDLIEILNDFVGTPKSLATNMIQLSKASKDYERAQKIMHSVLIQHSLEFVSKLGFISEGIAAALNVLRVAFVPFIVVTEYLSALIDGLQDGFAVAGPILKGVLKTITAIVTGFAAFKFIGMTRFAPALKALTDIFKFVTTRFLPVFLLLFTSFQIISRAAAKARLESAKVLPELGRKFMEGLKPFFKSLAWAKDQIEIFMDWSSSGLAKFFGGTALLEGFMDVVILLSRGVEQIFKGLYLLGKSFSWVVDKLVIFKDIFMEIFQTLFSYAYKLAMKVNPFASDQDVRSADASFQYSLRQLARAGHANEALGSYKDMLIQEGLYWDNNIIKRGKDPYATTKNEVNVNQPNINLNMKFDENMEPDRIALAIQQQFIKSALSPLSSDAVNNPVSSLANAAAG